jgi:hypothetical protein
VAGPSMPLTKTKTLLVELASVGSELLESCSMIVDGW